LWLAPLIAVKSSRVFHEHPDWFLRGEQGQFISAGFNWGEQLYALDTTQPAALEWLAQLIRQVRTWGFDYLKLDFLYAGALAGKRCHEMPREAAYRNGLQVMRDAMGAEAFFLTCGAPIIPSMGLCDAIRVSTDVAAEWENHKDVIYLHNFTVPSTRNAIRTTIHRLWLDALVHLDPDVTYFRSKECALTAQQKSLLQNLALICDFKATSDLPEWLTAAEGERLRVFLERKPKISRVSRYVFQVDNEVVDFNSAMPFPQELKGMEAIEAAIFGWLANHDWALKINDQMGKAALEKVKKSIQVKK
jgi:alpha-galactosidase